MKSVDKLKRLVRKARRITKAEQMEAHLCRFEQLGLDFDDVKRMAKSVDLEAEDLLLMNTHVAVNMVRRIAPPGEPGRKRETEDIAEFARLGRLRAQTWKGIFKEWKHRYPDDKRVKNPEHIREAYRRYFGDKAKRGY
jgi:hypothetical protein